MKIFILFFSLLLPLMGIKAQNIRDIGIKDIPKYKIKIRPVSIDPKLGTVRNPNEFLEDIELDTLIKSVATNISNSRDLDKPINYATQAALLLKADKSAISNIDNTRDIDKPISNPTQVALNYLTISTNTSLTGISNATTAQLNNKYDKSGGVITGDVTILKQDPILSLKNPTLGSNFYLYGGDVAKYSIDKTGHWFYVQDAVTAQFNKDISYINNPLQVSSYTNPKITTNATGGNIVMKMQSVDDYLGYIGTESNHSVGVITDNSIKMLVTANGNVGIGTTNPLEKLHIKWGNALIEAEKPSILMKTPTSIINAVSLSDNKVFVGNSTGISVEIGGGANTMHVQSNNGNVGIGNASPTKKLQVNGSIGFGTDGLRDLENELSNKVEKTYFDSQLALKADQTYTDTKLSLKADQTYTDTKLSLKADRSDLDGKGDLNGINSWAGINVFPILGLTPQPITNIFTPQAGLNLFANNLSQVAWRSPNGFVTSLNSNTNTANQTYILPNSSGTVALVESLTASNVGLGSVNNTADLAKPISTAAQAALNLKADKTYTDNSLSLKFDKTGDAITGDIAMSGNINYFGGAKITVSANGKSISIKPGGTAGAAIAKAPVDLYVAPAPIQEDSVRGYLYKGKQLFKQTFNNSNVTGTTVILNNIQDIYQLGGNITYTTANGNVVTYDLQSMVTTGLALLKYSISAGTLSINPYDYPNCTNQNFNVTAKYTKRP